MNDDEKPPEPAMEIIKQALSKKRNPFSPFAGKFVILLEDPQVRLHFVFLAPYPDPDIPGAMKNRIFIFREKDHATKFLKSKEAQAHYEGYNPQIHRYEALKEFEDHHQRPHWAFDSMVQFFGPAKAMDWISKLTLVGGCPRDPLTGLVLDWDSLKLPHLPDGVGGLKKDHILDASAPKKLIIPR